MTPLSIIVPTSLRRDTVAAALQALESAAAAYRGEVEVVVVADTSHSSAMPVRSIIPASAICIESERPGAAAARNAGLSVARNRVVLFSDDDCLVPSTWCHEMASGLSAAGTTAAAGPVLVSVNGPVTTFLGYQRFFDAPPISAGLVRYPITANCAIDRSQVGGAVLFDDVTFTDAGGEDVEFGHAIRAAGGSIAWLADAHPVVHVLPESIDDLAERFTRYGRASARLLLKRGRWQDSSLTAVREFHELLNPAVSTRRRFMEFRSQATTQAFFALQTLRDVFKLIGFFEETSATFGRKVLDIQADLLWQGWQSMAVQACSEEATDHVRSRIDTTVDMRDLGADSIHGIQFRRAILDRVAANLARFAPWHTATAAREVQQHLEPWTKLHMAETARADDLLRPIAAAFGEYPVAATELAQNLRAAGHRFDAGCRRLEKLMASRQLDAK